MPNYRNSPFFQVLVFVAVLLTSIFAFADTVAKKQVKLSGLFAKELSRHGNAEITNKPEYCTSKTRPLTVNQELSEILSYAMQFSEHVKAKSECMKVVGEDKYRFCRFYLHSANKTEQWSVGFTFLGNITDGEIKFDSLECFGTP